MDGPGDRSGRTRISRRHALAGTAGLALGIAFTGRLVAQGGQATPGATPYATPGATPAGTPGGLADPSAPRTIAHRYGETVVEGVPERVVTVGLTDQDYFIALGTVPVGVREWFGGFPGALWPWAADLIGDAPEPVVLPVGELDFEQIVALEPDLIIGVSGGLTEDEYGTLSAISPTIAQAADYPDYGAPWEVITRTVGLALGLPAEAETMIPAIEERFQAARDANPQFAGQSALLAAVVYDGSSWLYPSGPAPRFLIDLGFAFPEAAETVVAEDRQPVQLGPEELNLIDADVLVLGVYGEADPLLDSPIYQGLRVATEGRTILLPETSVINGALSFGSVLSLPMALEAMVPRLTAAADGDPATVVMPFE